MRKTCAAFLELMPKLVQWYYLVIFRRRKTGDQYVPILSMDR
ncbi:hypothetical protein [Candidatus Formimonas warabiya]|nr:hypothetical protein [Candidatus Formimonas warabiya]